MLSSSLNEDGRFEVTGLPDGSVSVFIMQMDDMGVQSTTLPGYRLSRKNKCLDPNFPDRLRGMVDRDITDLTILLEPGETPKRVPEVAPALPADFNFAKAGPITGVPPGDFPKSR